MGSDVMRVRLHLRQVRVLGVVSDTPFELVVEVCSAVRRPRCPGCGFACSRVHDVRYKRVRDLEVSGRASANSAKTSASSQSKIPWIGLPPGRASSRRPSARRCCHRHNRPLSSSSTAHARPSVQPAPTASSTSPNNAALAAPSTRAGTGPLIPNAIFPAAPPAPQPARPPWTGASPPRRAKQRPPTPPGETVAAGPASTTATPR